MGDEKRDRAATINRKSRAEFVVTVIQSPERA